ncbi:MAG TPA: HNH endonuclease [Solirubrobacteraceae bacterium]|nr:HNH endonuclease [Solirubrobacteraceae bacterium]
MSAVRKRYDWPAIAAFYEEGHTAAECQREFGVSNGAWHGAVQRQVIVLRDTGRRPRAPGSTREAVRRLLASGASQAEVAQTLGISASSVCFHVRNLGLAARADLSRRYDWEAIRAYYEAGHSAAECRRQFGFGVNAWADAIGRGAIRPRPRMEPLDAVLAAGRRRSRQHVKARLLLAGLKQHRCEACGLTEWRGRSLSLELHHVNGDGLDNRLENLRLLCPNCHSQTDTWGARNKGRRR